MSKAKTGNQKKTWKRVNNPLGWLVPGLGVKRWMLIILLGITLLAVGLAFLLLEVYRTAPDTWWLPILSTASLRALSRPVRVLIFGGNGDGLLLLGIWGINRSLLAPYRRSGKPMLDELTDHRRKERGPRIVAIGGGHGLATLLRGLKSHSYNITAVVTVADDGGSSGRIRRAKGIPPPGDIRNCLAALSSDEALMTQLFQYRFTDTSDELNGHPFGNLFISALSEITGSFEEAVVESGKVLAVQGKVIPATLHDVRLVADVQLPHNIGEVRVEGESSIPTFPGDVRRVWLEPNNPAAYPLAIQAILAAELIVVGPGSLFTSILPNLLVPDIAAAIRASRALKIYVCNVATQLGETEGYSCEDHVKVISDHVGTTLFDLVVTNDNFEAQLPPGTDWVKTTPEQELEVPIYRANFADTIQPWRHDSSKLART
ncbi:MAG: uridine diphosphate-N-acetylglucosamine-binding protein YvcK [Anaerolineae bacterium]|nr:uridine diphosphate-N-acetylglucosamine-binding protein YvcK [Anaerolineae bacterium]